MAKLVFGTVGTTTYPFDRFTRLMEHLASMPDIKVVYQYGFSPPPSDEQIQSYQFIGAKDYQQYLHDSYLVVAHAGIGSFMDLRRLSKKSLIVPRSGVLGEHVDDHQIQLARYVEGKYGASILYPESPEPEIEAIQSISVGDSVSNETQFVNYIDAWLKS